MARSGQTFDCFWCHRPFVAKTYHQKFCTIKCQQAEYHDRNKSTRNARTRAWNKTDAAKLKDQRKRFKKYGITLEQFVAMSNSQGDVCAICGGPPVGGLRRLSVDHITGSEPPVVRGLLCTNCNLAIGYLKDNPANAIQAAAYLRRAEILMAPR